VIEKVVARDGFAQHCGGLEIHAHHAHGVFAFQLLKVSRLSSCLMTL